MEAAWSSKMLVSYLITTNCIDTEDYLKLAQIGLNCTLHNKPV